MDIKKSDEQSKIEAEAKVKADEQAKDITARSNPVTRNNPIPQEDKRALAAKWRGELRDIIKDMKEKKRSDKEIAQMVKDKNGQPHYSSSGKVIGYSGHGSYYRIGG